MRCNEPARQAELQSLHIIGRVRSCFGQKFGTPRQPGLVPSARAEIVLQPEFAKTEALQGLEEYSHLWVLFWFHLSAEQGWRPTVRPPRLGGNRRAGVFATRSPFRPNPIGLSVVECRGWRQQGGQTSILIANHDLVDGTPVIDIKPHLPYADCPTGGAAAEAYAHRPGKRLQVVFGPGARERLAALPEPRSAELERLIRETLRLDPRPAYRDAAEERRYGIQLAGWEIGWRCREGQAWVESIQAMSGA